MAWKSLKTTELHRITKNCRTEMPSTGNCLHDFNFPHQICRSWTGSKDYDGVFTRKEQSWALGFVVLQCGSKSYSQANLTTRLVYFWARPIDIKMSFFIISNKSLITNTQLCKRVQPAIHDWPCYHGITMICCLLSCWRARVHGAH